MHELYELTIITPLFIITQNNKALMYRNKYLILCIFYVHNGIKNCKSTDINVNSFMVFLQVRLEEC